VAFDWLRRDIHLHVRLHPGGVLLAVSYAVAFWAARNVSVDQLYLPAGLRVAALLLCPARYWVYLIAGEYAFFALARYPLIPQYGLAWVVVASASLMPAVAGIVHTHRRWMASSNDTWLLSVALLAAIVVTALNQGLAYLLMPTQHVAVSWEGAARYAVGDYLGILLIAPLVVMWRRRRMAAESMRGWTLAAVVSLVVIGVNLMVLLRMDSTGLPGSHDPAVFTAQQILAATGTVLLLLGATTSHYYHRFRQNEWLGRRAIAMTRTTLVAGEQDRRERAWYLRNVGDDIDRSLQKIADTLAAKGQDGLALELQRLHAAQSGALRVQANLVYPVEIESAGLYVALRAGAIADAWAQTDRVLPAHLMGDPCDLSLDLQLAAFRSMADVVAVLLTAEKGSLRLRARTIQRGGQQGIVVIAGLLDPHRTLAPGTVELARQALGARALAYQGNVQCRGNRIRLVLRETRGCQAERHASAPGTRALPRSNVSFF